MSVEARRRHANAPGPIVVQISQFVSQHLDVVGSEVGLVFDEDVVSGSHGPLIHELRDEEEVRADANLGNAGVDNGAGRWISGKR